MNKRILLSIAIVSMCLIGTTRMLGAWGHGRHGGWWNPFGWGRHAEPTTVIVERESSGDSSLESRVRDLEARLARVEAKLS